MFLCIKSWDKIKRFRIALDTVFKFNINIIVNIQNNDKSDPVEIWAKIDSQSWFKGQIFLRKTNDKYLLL